MENKTIHLTISFSGIVSNIERNRGRMTRWDKVALKEIVRLFNQTREEYMKGNKEVVDQFFDLVN